MPNYLIIILLILIPLILILALFFYEIKDLYIKRRYKFIVYKKLYNYSVESDQLLKNNVHLLLNDDEISKIDHIFIADKYIYVVKDVYYDGMIYGNISDPYIFHINKNNKEIRIQNPLFENNRVVIDLMNKIDPSKKDNTIVNVVVYNSNLILPYDMKVKKQGVFFVSANELIPTIKEAEKDNITSIPHNKSEKLINLISNSSDKIKAQEKSIKDEKQKQKQH